MFNNSYISTFSSLSGIYLESIPNLETRVFKLLFSKYTYLSYKSVHFAP